MLELHYYNSNHGVFVKVLPPNNYSYIQELTQVCDFINDIPSADIVKVNGWYRMQNAPLVLRKYTQETKELIGFKLIDKNLKSKYIPEKLNLDQVQQYWNDDLDKYVWDSFSNIQSLYTEEYQVLPKTLLDIQFKAVCLGTLDITDYKAPETMKVKFLREGSYGAKLSDEKEIDLSTVVVYSDIEKMLIPEFLLHTRPCKLTSKQVYGIVRTHIIQNHDPKECCIDSNYDFCFSLSKYINTKPYQGDTSVKVRNKWASKKTKKKVKIFEMTYAGYQGQGGYNGYTCIEEWKADSLKELQEKIKDYLDQLIQYINTACVECDNCKGFGYNVKTLTTNQREF